MASTENRAPGNPSGRSAMLVLLIGSAQLLGPGRARRYCIPGAVEYMTTQRQPSW
ncbi:MAG: hypothetical protein QOJ60_1355 [Actinomycetota bacterium]|nr:hypothetical protein [Actinomycetota bacterium]